MSDTLLHCFACDSFSPQQAEELVCSQCQSDFVEIVQVERSPSIPTFGSRQANASAGGREAGPDDETGRVPGIQGMLSSLLSSILPQAESHNQESRGDLGSAATTPQSNNGPDLDQAAHSYMEQTRPPPFNDFFSQMFGQFPQGRAVPGPMGDSNYTRTTHGPGGSTFTFTFGSSSGNGTAFRPARDGPDGQQAHAPNPFLPAGFTFAGPVPGRNGDDGSQPSGIPDLATFLAQAFGAVPGTAAGDYASGAAFDNIISELMNRNPQSNVRPADSETIARIKRIVLDKEVAGAEGKSIGDECSICQEEYTDGETLAELKCRHAYHEECLLSWVKTNAVCPICRAPVTAGEDSPEQEDLD